MALRRNRVEIEAGPRIRIEPRVMQVLCYLAEHTEEVVSRDSILDAVRQGPHVLDEVLTKAIRELRRALGDEARDPKFLQTSPKRGHRLLAPVSTLDATGEVIHGKRQQEGSQPVGWQASIGTAAAADLALAAGLALWRSRPDAPPAVSRFLGNTNYDVNADGTLSLMARLEEAPPLRQITLVVNWLEELERFAPTDN